jgi:DHA1 family inner membrane transport protein
MNTREKIILLLLATLNFTHIMDFMILMPLGNHLMPYFKISSQQFSFLVAAYTFSAGVSGFLAAFFVDKFDRKRVLLFGYIGFLLGTVCCGLSPGYVFLLLSRIVAGTFGGLIAAQVLSIVADIFPYERRASAMGYIMAAFSVASVFGVPFGLYLANHLNWHAPFFFVAGLGTLLVPFIIRYMPRMNRHIIKARRNKISPLQLVSGIISDRNQVLALSLSACMMLGHFLIVPFLNPFMEFNMGFSKNQTPMVYTVGGFLTLFSSPIIGRLADKAGKHRLFVIMILLAVAPIWLITNLPQLPFYVVLCITGFWFVVSSGRAIPAQAMISNVVPPERRGSFMSFNSSMQQIAVGIASLLAGFIVVRDVDNKMLHYNITGYLSIGLILICIFISARMQTRLPKNDRMDKEVQKQVEEVPLDL